MIELFNFENVPSMYCGVCLFISLTSKAIINMNNIKYNVILMYSYYNNKY